MSDTTPLISVCIPTYNYGRFLPDTIRSVLSQTVGNFELIISDNCSTDDTAAVVERFRQQDSRIVYHRTDTNIGMAANWNRCLQLASGEYVKILCADDILEPSCLQLSADALTAHPEATLVTGIRTLTDKDLKPIGSLAYSDRLTQEPGNKVIRSCFFNGNLIGEPSAVLFRRIDAQRGFNGAYTQLTDIEMWMHLLEKGDLIFLPSPLCRFRQHEEQGTKLSIRSFTVIADELRFFQDYIDKDYLGNTFWNRERWRYLLAHIIWNHRYYGVDTRTVIRKLRQYYPLPVFFLVYVMKLSVDIMKRTARRIYIE